MSDGSVLYKPQLERFFTGLKNLFAAKSDIPTSLKNPNNLTITLGTTNYIYDGSTPVSITINSGDGVSY